MHDIVYVKCACAYVGVIVSSCVCECSSVLPSRCHSKSDPARYLDPRGGTTTSRASEINKFMSLLSMALPIENLSIITFDSWLSRGRG